MGVLTSAAARTRLAAANGVFGDNKAVGNVIISQVAQTLRQSELSSAERGRVPALERRLIGSNVAETIGRHYNNETSSNSFNNMDANLTWYQQRSQSFTPAQSSAIFREMEAHPDRFASRLGGTNFRSYVTGIIQRAPAQAAAARPAPAQPQRDAPARPQPRPSADRQRSAPPPAARPDSASDDAAAAASDSSAPPPAPEPVQDDGYGFVAQSTRLLADPDTRPQAAETLLQGAAPIIADKWGVDESAISGNVTALLQADPALANRVASEMAAHPQTLRADIEGGISSMEGFAAFAQNYPQTASVLYSAMAKTNPEYMAEMTGATMEMQLLTVAPNTDFGARVNAVFGPGGAGNASLQALLQDPEKVSNLFKNMGGLLQGENGEQLSPEAMEAVVADIEAKPEFYLRMLSSDNPKTQLAGMSNEAYAALAQTQQPSGIEGMLMRFMLGDDFDYSNPANRGVVACLAAQPGAIMSCMRQLSAEGEAISAGGGSRSMFQSARLYLRAATDMDFRDEVNAVEDVRNRGSAWERRNGITFDNTVVQRLDVETGLMTTLPPPGQAQPPTEGPATDVPGNRRVPQAGDIVSVDPNAYI
ncbi:MAG: hypothetical protein AB7E85_02440 [Pseudobdellovibrionaceae bacterium]